MEKEQLLKKALGGDIISFQALFAEFQNQLRSYLYRLLADRNDVDDLTHDTFIRAFDKIPTFNQDASLKTWIFKIATNLAYDLLRKRKRWEVDAQDRGREYSMATPDVKQACRMVHATSPAGNYEIKEHIDYCFICISKTLPVENQVALILKDMYDFSVADICQILEKTEGVIKHLLIDARKTMIGVFDNRCALINKNGACHQCSELNGIYNPKQDQQQELMKLDLVKGSKKFRRDELYAMRTQLIKAIDLLHSNGADLTEILFRVTRKAIGEIDKVMLLLPLFLGLLFTSGHAQGRMKLAEAKRSIAESHRIYFQAFSRGDSTLLIDRYTKDCWIMPPNAASMCGQDAPLDLFRAAYYKRGVRNGRFITTDLYGNADEFVTEVGFFQLFDAGNNMIDNGKFLVLWKKTPAGWKIFRDSFNSDRSK
jgi:RNA polymerase sigma-70 factor (ECF subfamily)